jgi:hypothetical protein
LTYCDKASRDIKNIAVILFTEVDGFGRTEVPQALDWSALKLDARRKEKSI